MQWMILQTNGQDYLGFLPTFLSADNPKPAREQLDDNYQHGGGWRPFEGFKLNKDTMQIKYPGDPPYDAQALTLLRDEFVIIYPHGWVMVLQKDGSYEIARMD